MMLCSLLTSVCLVGILTSIYFNPFNNQLMKKITTFLSAMILSTCAIAQIPNGGFETWMNMGSYTMPTDWDNMNAMTSSMTTYTCMQGTPGNPGSAYLKLVSKNVAGMGVVPGVAVCGTIDMSNMADIKPHSGFAFNQRPAYMTGSWQYMAAGSDQGFVAVMLTKWNISMNMRDTVAIGYQMLQGMAMSWTPFSLNLTYVTNSYPDSAIVVLSASNLTAPVANSYLYADNLAFAGNVPFTGVAGLKNAISNASLYPNPASAFTNISYKTAASGNVYIKVADVSGRTVKQLNSTSVPGNNTIRLNTADMSKGIYFVNIIDGLNSQLQKLVIE